MLGYVYKGEGDERQSLTTSLPITSYIIIIYGDSVMKNRTRTLVASLVLFSLLLMPDLSLAQPSDPGASDLQRFAKLEQAIHDAAYSTPVSREQWKNFCDRIEGALASHHEGFKQGAMRLIIAHGDKLKVDRDGVYNLVRIYRNDRIDNMRRMAVVALGKLADSWSMDFLKRSIRFETTPKVRHTVYAVVTSYYHPEFGPAKVGS